MTAPGSYALIAGTRGSFLVSFQGTGVDRATAQASGTGLSASVLNVSTGTVNVSVSAASNFTGGSVTVALINNSHEVIKSQTIAVPLMNLSGSTASGVNQATVQTTQTTSAANSSTATITAPVSFTAQAGKSTPLAVSFSGTGIAHADVQTSVPGLTAQVTNLALTASPATSTANILLTPTPDCTGGTITFRVSNSAGTIIGSKTISVAIGSPDASVTANSSVPSVTGSSAASGSQTPATAITAPAQSTLSSVAPTTTTSSASAGQTASTGFTAVTPNQTAVGSPAASEVIQQANTYISQLQTLSSQTSRPTVTAVSQAKSYSDNLSGLRSSNAQEQGSLSAKAAYGACLYNGIKQRSVGFPAPQCETPSTDTTIQQQLTLTSVSVNKNSGTTNDIFRFSAATNTTASMVSVVGAATTYSMASSDNKNWIVDLTGDKLGVGDKVITIRAYSQNSAVAVTKTVNVTVTQGTYQPWVGYMTSSSTPVLDQNGSGQKIGTVDNTEPVTVTGEQGSYYLITYQLTAGGTKSGYVPTSTVSKAPSSIQAGLIGSNYPYKNAKPIINHECAYGGYDQWGYCERSCTSFVAWALSSSEKIAFKGAGNANTWGSTAKSRGYSYDKNPKVGDVAWYNTGTYGHVAWVAKVNGNKVTVEEYNKGCDHCYKVREMDKSEPTGYIHFK